MATAEYTHFNNAQLCRMLVQAKQIEVDLQERVAARVNHVDEASDGTLAGVPDPTHRRLAFLLLKWERQRRDAENELTIRGDTECLQERA